LQRTVSTQLPAHASQLRLRVANACRVLADWTTLELWPYLDDIHHESFLLPDWILDDRLLGAAPSHRHPQAQAMDHVRKVIRDDQVLDSILVEQFLTPLATELCPVNTLRDGNCLPHAVMMVLCGMNDRSSLFRHLMQLLLAAGNRVSLKLRQVIEQENVRLAQERCKVGRSCFPEAEHARCAAASRCVVFDPKGDDLFWRQDVCEPCRPALQYSVEDHLVRTPAPAQA
jgi:hypothetical protein